jgi:hypothetical protein
MTIDTSVPTLLSDATLAEVFGEGVTERTVADWRRRYGWPHLTVGRSVRYTPEHVEQILRSHQAATGPKPTALPGQTRRSASRARAS